MTNLPPARIVITVVSESYDERCDTHDLLSDSTMFYHTYTY
jgi:hypothetical protein